MVIKEIIKVLEHKQYQKSINNKDLKDLTDTNKKKVNKENKDMRDLTDLKNLNCLEAQKRWSEYPKGKEAQNMRNLNKTLNLNPTTVAKALGTLKRTSLYNLTNFKNKNLKNLNKKDWLSLIDRSITSLFKIYQKIYIVK